ncbi:phytoene dehydrogenase [Mycobacterium sp. MS1601]|uniref:phytoene desaturase family protein n=1 Tax=Mycobacterium sp. MS1601 TaxID=1936029 RepID=UPI000979839D|nr:phytoene desaturase family protein [Mycobacterium sp. MS1601]AQA01228.1 phytoene dehydrogenase [Mycobacterium sp. MS1601]
MTLRFRQPRRVVVVGAGLSGLSAAMHLAGRGVAVTVLERGHHPGGRMGRADIDGYRLDTGPTVLTMPEIIDDAFAAVGESSADRLDLIPVAPAYRASFADGTALQVHSDAAAMAAEVERFAGPQQAQGYLQLRQWLTRLYDVEFDGFIGSNFQSPLSLVNSDLLRLLSIGGFRRWDSVVRRFLTDERLQRVFTFQALYAGVPPQRALAVYAVIAYMDTVAGVYFPRGGMRAVPDAMAAAASAAGVEFRYGTSVTELIHSGGVVSTVGTDTGERFAADAVVLTTELPDTYRMLGRTPRRLLRLRPAPSAVVAHIGCRATGSDLPHHNILFGDAWRDTFREIIDHGTVMSDPSLLVTRPTVADPTLAPEGRDLLYVLAPAPNTEVGTIDWSAIGPAYTEQMIETVDRRLPGLIEDPQLLDVVDPSGWARQGMAAGTPFALAHNFTQTGPFRPANRIRGIDNVVLAGSSTVPGVGVPTAVISGRLAAERLTGSPSRRQQTMVVR